MAVSKHSLTPAASVPLQGLSDPDDYVRQEMTKAGLRLIEVHGAGSMELLHPLLQNQLNKPDTGLTPSLFDPRPCRP